MSSEVTQVDVGYAIKHLQQELRTRLDAVLAAHDMTMARYAALAALEELGDASNAELARRCFVTPQTMHRVLGDLERAGCIVRRADPAHGRVRLAGLTDAGRTVLTTCRTDVDAVNGRMLSRLSDAEVDALRGLLQRCLAALQEDGAR